MGAVEFRKVLATFLHGRQGIDGPEEFERAKSPKIRPAQKDRATKRLSGRSLLTQSDIEAAVDWRLAGISATEIDAIARALDPFAADFREDRPEVAAVLADLRRPGDRRDPWSLACAVLAADAMLRGDAEIFFSAGFEVVGALRQSRRGQHHNRVGRPLDALDTLIAAESMPAARMFAEFASLAEPDHDVLYGFDEDDSALICRLDPEDVRLTRIGWGEFNRRVERLRRAA